MVYDEEEGLMVKIIMGHCIECHDPVWQKPHKLKVCPLCVRGRELSETYGTGDTADSWCLALEGAVALGTKRRWEKRKYIFDTEAVWV